MYKLHILPRAFFPFSQGPGAFFRQSALNTQAFFVNFTFVRSRERKWKNNFTLEKSSAFLFIPSIYGLFCSKMSKIPGLSGICVQILKLFGIFMY